ncbi:hypothetical protein KO527_05335 [Pseudoalteromonas sp. C2R02]|uniref:hypothetical protein n=1 Tax=Pseudoalteromonas sp. C2R02 TaxID=2841565 RepID=UPI001C093613|nr:hypothetical protein [Pseudoalteromonas sp. C2R02]MBU2968771.1 hypothetical protein [Pseudoalteromonas sp. C2R02]
MQDKKILCISTVGNMPCAITAAWRDQKLTIFKKDFFSTSAEDNQTKLTELITDRAKKGFTIFIEERFKTIKCRGAYHVNLTDADKLAKTQVVNVAMTNYIAMTQSNMIAFSEAVPKFAIAQSNIDEKIDDSGKITYSLDWSAIKADHRALLLVIYAVVSNDPTQSVVLKGIFSALNKTKEKLSPVTTRINNLKSNDAKRAQALIDKSPCLPINSTKGVPEGFTLVE